MPDNDLVEQVARSVCRCSDLSYTAVARAAIEAIEAAGYVVVPREPTVEMQRAGFLMLDKTRDCDCNQKDVWAAMIEAVKDKDESHSARPTGQLAHK